MILNLTPSRAHIFAIPTFAVTNTTTYEPWYTGSPITPSILGFYSDSMTMNGDLSGTELGSYTITFSLKTSEYNVWADGTTEDKVLTWIITKAKFQLRNVGSVVTSTGYVLLYVTVPVCLPQADIQNWSIKPSASSGSSSSINKMSFGTEYRDTVSDRVCAVRIPFAVSPNATARYWTVTFTLTYTGTDEHVETTVTRTITIRKG